MTFFEALFKKEFQNWKKVDAVQLPSYFDFAPLVQGLDENLSIIARFYYDVVLYFSGALPNEGEALFLIGD